MDAKKLLWVIGVSCLLGWSFGVQAQSSDSATREFEEYSAAAAEETLVEFAEDADAVMGKTKHGPNNLSIKQQNFCQEPGAEMDAYVRLHRCFAKASQANVAH